MLNEYNLITANPTNTVAAIDVLGHTRHILKAFSGEIPKVDPRDAELFERAFVGEPQGVLASPTTDTTDMKYVRSVVSRTSV